MVEAGAQNGRSTLNSLALLGAQGLAFGLSFALPLILVRHFSIKDYGLFKQAFLLIAATANLLPLGFSMSAYYFLPREPAERQGAVVFNIVCFHAALGGIAFVALSLWPNIPSLVFGGSEFTTLAPLIGLVILFWTTARVSEVITIAHGEVAFATLFIVGSQLSRTALLTLAAVQFGTVRSLLIAAAAQAALQTLLFLLYLHSRFPGFWRRCDGRAMQAQLNYGIPLGLAALIQGLLIDLPGYVVSHRFGVEAFAIYSVGLFAIPLVNLCSDPFNVTVLRPISELQQQGKTREILTLVAGATRGLSAFLMPVTVFLAITGRDWIRILFTEQYLASWPVFLASLLTIPLRAVVTDPVLRGYAEHRFFPLRVRTAVLLMLLPALLLVPAETGLVGVVLTVAFFFSVDRLVEIAKVVRILGIRGADLALFTDVGKIMVAAGIAGIATVAAKAALPASIDAVEAMAVATAIFGTAYGIAIAALGVVTPAEWADIRRYAMRRTA